MGDVPEVPEVGIWAAISRVSGSRELEEAVYVGREERCLLRRRVEVFWVLPLAVEEQVLIKVGLLPTFFTKWEK